METCPQFIRRREVVRALISRAINEMEDLDEGLELDVKLELLQEKNVELQSLDKEIFNAVSDCDDNSDLMDEAFEAEKFQERIRMARRKYGLTPNTADDGTVADTKKTYRLPKLELRKFDLTPENWTAFWAQYHRIYEDTQVRVHDKFQYLLMSLDEHCKARKMMEAYPQEEIHYEKAIDSLKKRFGREEFLIEIYTRKILALMSTNEPLTNVYDKLVSYIMALESLGMAMSKCAFMLYPIVESCLPAKTLREWERVRLRGSSTMNSQISLNTVDDYTPLQELMDFLETEVRSEERVLLAQRPVEINVASSSALASVTTKQKLHCVFCKSANSHSSINCSEAAAMSYDKRREIAMENNCCLACLRRGHGYKTCWSNFKCKNCSKSHVTIMCPSSSRSFKHEPKVIADAKCVSEGCDQDKQLAALYAGVPYNFMVYLKTLLVKICHKGKEISVRALLDDGSHRSYITSALAKNLQLAPVGGEVLSHGLFGGLETKAMYHKKFLLRLKSCLSNNTIDVHVIDNDTICGDIPRVNDSVLLAELAAKGIHLTDIGNESGPIDILLGADVIGRILTGRMTPFKSGLTAIETFLGWSILGAHGNRVKNMVNSALTNLPTLWDLETIGITDPIECVSKKCLDDETMAHFKRTITRSSDGRYEVSLPWLTGHPPLHDNKNRALARLQSLTKRLRHTNSYQAYDDVFTRWETDGIIEEVHNCNTNNLVHFLPHRGVFREGKSTKLRPVFDPSDKIPGYSSLSECLSTGPSLSQQIVPVLMRFRLGRFAVTGDIRQAFQMIFIQEKDRDVLRFLWWKSSEANELKIFRHCRVPFGVSTSPFLLNATIQYHLENSRYRNAEFNETRIRLQSSFYVDDCVVGNFESEMEAKDFIEKATTIMSEGGFDLRSWAINSEDRKQDVAVLGLKWNLSQDTLSFVPPVFPTEAPLTKHMLLSLVNRVYDPLGITAGAMIPPKLILQETWKQKIEWSEELPTDLQLRFRSWAKHINALRHISFPRRIVSGNLDSSTLHVMTDGSNLAYGACVFIRCETSEGVSVQLVSAKARVAPLSSNTIPRIELLGACLGVRLSIAVQEALQPMQTYYWTDSAVVLFWIKRNEPWATFVGNRVKEIRKYCKMEDWRHISGELNVQADHLSRGCNFDTLVQSQWWNGPKWMYDPEHKWPQSEIGEPPEAILERKQTILISMAVITDEYVCAKLAVHCSTYIKAKRVCAWIFRFHHNALSKSNLDTEEINMGEIGMIKALQEQWPRNEFPNNLSIEEKDGLLLVRTKLIHGSDVDCFQRPILLPEHPITKLMAEEVHRSMGHCGIRTMLTCLREHYWILHIRKICKSVLSACVICKRFRTTPMKTPEASLPADRIANVPAFLHSGCDMAGPIFLTGGKKAWILVFTCAVYRAVHLELVSSLSADSFMQGLRRFIGRRGRCALLRCDNGENFVATCRVLNELDWNSIQDQSTVLKIVWKFNVPGAPWWTGFVERMVGLVKSVLKKVLAQACLSYEEMNTILCECENVINSRPLTYMSDESTDLVPLTPAHFIRGMPVGDMDDLDLIDSKHHVQRFRYLQTIRVALRKRFREEYLAELVRTANTIENRHLTVGEVVLIGSENIKRQKWPLAVVTEMIPGIDGIVRTVKVRLANSELFRPIQRIYPLEIKSELFQTHFGRGATDNKIDQSVLSSSDVTLECSDTPVTTRVGRTIRPPDKLNL